MEKPERQCFFFSVLTCQQKNVCDGCRGSDERLARESETDPHSKPVTKHKDDKLYFRVKFDVGEIKAALYRPTVVWITGVFMGIIPLSSWLAAGL